MLTESFLQTVTIKTKSVSYEGTRQQVPSWEESATGVNATISPMASMSYKYSLLGATTDATHLCFMEPDTTVSQGDIVIDEDTDEEFTVTSKPQNYLNPITKETSHIQCELKPREPNE